MSKEKRKREKNIQDKRKEKLGRKEICACEKCAKINQMSTKKRREKRGHLSQSGDLSNAQNRFGVKKNCLGR
jgi:hypothetical protein